MRDSLIALLEPELEKLGYGLVELEYRGRGAGGLLRLYIEGPGRIGLDDCERASRRVSAVLDVEDPIPGSYRLEVSSPGADRPLRTAEHFRRFAGREASVRLARPCNGRKRLSGRLLDMEGEMVRMEVDGAEWAFPLGEIERARLKPES